MNIKKTLFNMISLLALGGMILPGIAMKGKSATPFNRNLKDTGLKKDQQLYWPAPATPKPGYLQPVTDPIFGTTITRIVGDPGTPIPGIPGKTWAAEQERHGYSKRAAWNSDQSLIYLDRHSPVLWLDGNTYQVSFTRKKPGRHLLWSPTEPNIMYHTGTSENCQVGRYDVIKDHSVKLIDLHDYTDCSFGEGEGNFTDDGTRVAVYGKRKKDGKFVVFVADVVKQIKGADFEVTDLDNCTLSPLGNYIVLCSNADHISVLRATDGKKLWEENRYGLPSHFDVQVDQNGDEVVAGVGKTAPYTGKVIKRKLADGTITVLVNSGYASHTSGRALKRPGWVYVTYASENAKRRPYINEIDAVKLDGSSVERLCHIHNHKSAFPEKDQYYLEAHGCPSPDGRRVIFASDWDSGHYPVQAFVVDFRNILFDKTEK